MKKQDVNKRNKDMDDWMDIGIRKVQSKRNYEEPAVVQTYMDTRKLQLLFAKPYDIYDVNLFRPQSNSYGPLSIFLHQFIPP